MLWRRVRAGAANVAGVRYQLAVAAFLMADARGELRIEKMTPEGLEDIDCQVAGGTTLLVQTKERAAGDARIGPAGIVAAIEHAAKALRMSPNSQFVLVTDAEYTGGFVATDFGRTVSQTVPDASNLIAARSSLAIDEIDIFLQRTHLVHLSWEEVQRLAQGRLAERFQMPPAVSALAYAALVEHIGEVSAEQRSRERADAIGISAAEVDAIAHRVRALVDYDALSEAEHLGCIAPLDFTQPLMLSVERFLLGVDVEPGHIAADLDVARPSKLEQIFTALNEDRYALIAGPSGSGKSALLWRAAFELGGRFRLLRLRRAVGDDVVKVLRYVEAQMASEWSPILLCADDLGRGHLVGWESLVDGLMEVPHVYLLGAVREENFTTSLLRGRAQVVRSHLDRQLAEEVVSQLKARKVPLQVEPEEAIAYAGGLLMEFLALLVSGRRLESIVREQADARLAPERFCEREILRSVCTVHARGVVLPAACLREIISKPEELHAALQCLEAEFVLRRVGDDCWSGVHELRSNVAKNRLHELPPPTESETIAGLIRYVGTGDRRALIVGAAVDELSLAPIVQAGTDLIVGASLGSREVFEILDALIEAEEIAHARACLGFLSKCGSTLNTQALLPLLQMIKDGSVDWPASLPNGLEINTLATALPERRQSYAEQVAAEISESGFAEAIENGPVEDAVRLVELLAFLGKGVTLSNAELVIQKASAAELALHARAVAAAASFG